MWRSGSEATASRSKAKSILIYCLPVNRRESLGWTRFPTIFKKLSFLRGLIGVRHGKASDSDGEQGESVGNLSLVGPRGSSPAGSGGGSATSRNPLLQKPCFLVGEQLKSRYQELCGQLSDSGSARSMKRSACHRSEFGKHLRRVGRKP